MESMFSYLFDLTKENIAAEISNAIANSNVTASVDGDKKVIKSKRIFICSKDGQTAIWLNDTKSVNNPHIYVIPNKEWKFVAQDIIIAPEQPIDVSLINIDGSNLKKVSLMRNTLNVLDCLKGCSIDAFSVYMGDVKPGFENAIRSLNVKRMEYMYSIAYPGLLENIAEQLDSDLLIIPSSIHEVLILPESYIDSRDKNPPDYLAMIKEVNETQLTDDEILGDCAYHYRRDTNSIEF